MRAAAWGIERSYVDYSGARKSASKATIGAIAQAMGAGGEAPPQAPVRFVQAGKAISLRPTQILTLEDGSELQPNEVRRLPLPSGYHRITEESGDATRVVSSPRACYLPEDLRVWGWTAQLYAARSRKSWGIGDLGDLRSLARWSARQGAGALLVNPLHAVMPGPGQQPSPYYPSSRCFLNPLYLRIEDVAGARDLPGLEDLARRGKSLNKQRVIDREQAYELKMRALHQLWNQVRDESLVEEFRRARGELVDDFGTYMTACEVYGRDRERWPAGLQHARGSGVARFRRKHRDRIHFHIWVQALLDHQLQRAGAASALIVDLPVGVDPAGADAWMWNDSFADGMTVGAPPDEFNTKGQDWGLPPLDPWKLRTAGYEPFIETVRAAMRHCAGVRIDHVMGLFRLYWIPRGSDARNGAYVRYKHSELLDIVALESERAGAYVVGEDLGTVEPVVREEMSARSMMSYKLMWFEDDAPRTYPELSLAALTSHDLATVAGLWSGSDLAEQERLDLAPNVDAMNQTRARLKKRARVADATPVEEVIERAYRALGTAPSRVVMATLEDALAVTERPNHPGTSGEGRNWTLALPVALEELRTRDLPKRIAAALGTRRRA